MKSFRFPVRFTIVCALVLAVGIPAVAVGFGEGRKLVLGKRNPTGSTRALGSETEIIANNSTYGTRQSNKRDGDGGGAIYGCRSSTGHEPCVRANNLKGGRAFEFVTSGKEAGRIQTGSTSGAPFTTNATGVATGLNADKVDGNDASDFAAATQLRFAMVSATGGLATTAGGATGASKASASNTYTVTFNRNVTACSYTASPVGTAAAEAPAVAGVSGNANAVQVNTGAAPTSFHLQVIC